MKLQQFQRGWVRNWVLTPFLFHLLAGCGSSTEPDSHEFTLLAFGTLVTIEIVTSDRDRAVEAVQALESLYAVLERDWHAFGKGELARINAALLAGESVETTAELAALIQRSLEYRSLSEGHFDPVIGDLVELWGFADFDTLETTPEPPGDASIDAWQNVPAVDRRISVSGRTISASGPVQIDLGGVAKGTVLNLSAITLREHGVTDALIDAGGDIRVIGRSGSRRWTLGIRDPFTDGIIGTVRLEPGEAIVTSGNYERTYEHAGRRIHHVLDPRTGRPVEDTAGVTVIHTDAELADAAATALMVAGTNRFGEIAARMGIESALIIETTGQRQMTPAMAQRLEPLPVRE